MNPGTRSLALALAMGVIVAGPAMVGKANEDKRDKTLDRSEIHPPAPDSSRGRC
jgi:hypothetical protein